jgi:hypothetical protein
MRSVPFFQTASRIFFALGLLILISSFSSRLKMPANNYKGKIDHCRLDTLPGAEQIKTPGAVEVEASVDAEAWKSHLEKGLQPLVEKAARKGMKPGLYTIQVRFLIEKDGSISDVKALNDPGFGLAEGIVKVIRKAPKWMAGTVNGSPARSYHSQPVSFIISK